MTAEKTGMTQGCDASPGHGPSRGGRGVAPAQAEGQASPSSARRKRQKCSFFSAPPQSADLRRRRVQGSRPCSLRGPERLETLRAGAGMQYPRKKRGVCEGGKPPLPERAKKRYEVKKAGSVSERHLRTSATLVSTRRPGPPHLPSPALPEQGTGKRVPPELHPGETFFAGDPDPFPKTAKRRWRLTYCRFGRDDAGLALPPG